MGKQFLISYFDDYNRDNDFIQNKPPLAPETAIKLWYSRQFFSNLSASEMHDRLTKIIYKLSACYQIILNETTNVCFIDIYFLCEMDGAMPDSRMIAYIDSIQSLDSLGEQYEIPEKGMIFKIIRDPQSEQNTLGIHALVFVDEYEAGAGNLCTVIVDVIHDPVGQFFLSFILGKMLDHFFELINKQRRKSERKEIVFLNSHKCRKNISKILNIKQDGFEIVGMHQNIKSWNITLNIRTLQNRYYVFICTPRGGVKSFKEKTLPYLYKF